MTSLPERPPSAPTPKEADYISLEPGEYTEADSPDVEPTTETTSSSQAQNPPLPEEIPPPLPSEPPPEESVDDGWAPVWDETAQAFYFYNRFTQATQWENPRVPNATVIDDGPPGAPTKPAEKKPAAGGYDPAIHGDYDPEADYAKAHQATTVDTLATTGTASDPAQTYAATGAFNRFTGRWQAADMNPENFNDENKAKRQMNAFFDVDAAANSHDGKSLKAERSNKKLSKKELKAFREKRKEKKEEKRRAWLRD